MTVTLATPFTQNNFAVELSDCVFTDVNHAYAVTLENMAEVIVKNCLVTHCSGAIFCVQLKAFPRTMLTIVNTSVLHNSQKIGDKGGALYIEAVDLTMSNS